MSRPFHFLLPAIFLASALAVTGCVGTIYDKTYSYKKNYFKPPEDKKEVSAETILGALDKKPDAADAAALTTPDVPGLPPAGLPPAGLPPAAPDAAIPGLPPPGAPAAPPPAK